MAHFAKVKNGIVIKVIVAEQEFIDNLIEVEPGEWIQTSYNTYGGVHSLGETPLRKNYAGVGFNYDGTGFYAPQPYASWTFNSTSYLWEAPLTYPTDDLPYKWDEELYQSDNMKGWVEITND